MLDENEDNVPDAVIITESSLGGIWYKGNHQEYEWEKHGFYNYYGNATYNWGSAKLPIQYFDNLNNKFIGYIYFLD